MKVGRVMEIEEVITGQGGWVDAMTRTPLRSTKKWRVLRGKRERTKCYLFPASLSYLFNQRVKGAMPGISCF